jgi:murein DD-endopeptidase MepM/ murein hydrolase activator NlpD
MSLDPVASTAASLAPSADDSARAQQARVADLASEFEAMLLTQMLREMRQAGSWAGAGAEDGEAGGLGNGALFDAIDVELARGLAKARSLGLREALVREVRPDLAAQASVAVAADPRVTSAFGWRLDPLTGAPAFHRGIDVRAAYGADVAAVGSGRVVFAGTDGGYGETVVVDHGGGLRTRYAHLSSMGVGTGDAVTAGDRVGQAGRTGRATGTHVHFEATLDGQPVDPEAVPGLLKLSSPPADVKAGRWRDP